MTASQFLSIVAAIYAAPHLPTWAGGLLFIVFGGLALAIRYWGPDSAPSINPTPTKGPTP